MQATSSSRSSVAVSGRCRRRVALPFRWRAVPACGTVWRSTTAAISTSRTRGDGTIWRRDKNGDFAMWSDGPLLKGTTAAGPCGLVHPAVPSFGPLGANGIAFNKHGDMLVANTDFGEIIRIPTHPDGSAGTALVFTGPDCNLWGADGIGMDNADNLYVAANSKGQIDRLDPVGPVEALGAGDPLSFPSDLAFGTGRGDRKDIFISNFAAFPTSAGAPGVLDMNVGIPGRPIG